MRPTRMLIFTILLMFGLCGAAVSGREQDKRNNTRKRASDGGSEVARENSAAIKPEDEEDSLRGEEETGSNLPILPPIILLDFGNGTDDDNSTLDEKSKRTVNNGLGYGYNRNTLHTGRYNYYFPGGKTGTTVSIEESISPFLPKTIIERIQPNGQRHQSTQTSQSYAGLTQQNIFNGASSALFNQDQRNPNLQFSNQLSPNNPQTFGLRTKLEKAPAALNFNSQQNYASTAKPEVGQYNLQHARYRNPGFPSTTSSSLEVGPTGPTAYAGPSSLTFTGPNGNSFNYALPNGFAGQSAGFNAQTYAEQRPDSANSETYESPSQSSLGGTANYDSQFASGSSQVSNTPKYTIENGVRYENKIYWKYPDGRISEMPPQTYVETSYPEGQQPPETQAMRPQSPLSIYETEPTENGIYSQGPIQFPTVPESGSQQPSPFISSETLSSSIPQQQVYRLGYQSLVSQKQSANLAQQAKASNSAPSYSVSSGSSTASQSLNGRFKSNLKSQRNKHPSSMHFNPKPVSRYMVNSPNPEYTDSYTTEPTLRSTTPTSFFTASASGNPKKQNPLGSKGSNNYANVQYPDLLNYHPSISQYIRDPSSILNVHPTFVQAGNSLVPVIILRVDGAPPVQPKPTENVNLKALLQDYLLNYANSIQNLARQSSYDLGADATDKTQSAAPDKNPLLDFIRFTQNDARGSLSYRADSYTGKSSYATSNLDDKQYPANKQYSANKFGERLSGRQNVRIVEDPRYVSYKLKN